MKRILLALTILALASASFGMSFVQIATNAACTNATTCVATFSSPTGAGHLIVCYQLGFGANNRTVVSCTGAGTSALCPTSECHVFGATNYNIDAAYVLSSTSGNTAITVTINSANPSWAIAVLEYAPSGTVTYDKGGASVNASCTTSCVGQALTLTGTNDTIVQAAVGGPNVTAISGCYTNPNGIFSGIGMNGCVNTSSGTAPTWTLSAGGGIALGAIAFKDAGGGKLPIVFQ